MRLDVNIRKTKYGSYFSKLTRYKMIHNNKLSLKANLEKPLEYTFYYVRER
jgi:hypothetical protein